MIPQPDPPLPGRPARPTLAVDVVMRCEPVPGPMSRWQSVRWALADVVVRAAPGLATGQHDPAAPAEPRRVEPANGEDPPGVSHWLHTGFVVELFRDDVEGYFLNLSSPSPCFWVVWRPDEGRLHAGEPMAVPQTVTLSYHDAGRWLDAQERVDQVPAPADVVAWLHAFVQAHGAPEPKRRRRPESFRPLTDRFGQPASISTGKR